MIRPVVRRAAAASGLVLLVVVAAAGSRTQGQPPATPPAQPVPDTQVSPAAPPPQATTIPASPSSDFTPAPFISALTPNRAAAPGAAPANQPETVDDHLDRLQAIRTKKAELDK